MDSSGMLLWELNSRMQTCWTNQRKGKSNLQGDHTWASLRLVHSVEISLIYLKDHSNFGRQTVRRLLKKLAYRAKWFGKG